MREANHMSSFPTVDPLKRTHSTSPTSLPIFFHTIFLSHPQSLTHLSNLTFSFPSGFCQRGLHKSPFAFWSSSKKKQVILYSCDASSTTSTNRFMNKLGCAFPKVRSLRASFINVFHIPLLFIISPFATSLASTLFTQSP